jgi:hypothetical protein
MPRQSCALLLLRSSANGHALIKMDSAADVSLHGEHSQVA